MDDPMNAGTRPKDDPDDERDDLTPVEDEYDPFADMHLDPPPREGEEGDDRVHADSDA
jgi:hypothetical protein